METSNRLMIETLGEGWSDKDNVLLHACFQLLTDCVEKENLLNGHINWSENLDAKKELSFLYDWWKDRIQEEENEKFDPIWTKGQYEADTEMLVRLVKMRKFLWT